MSISAFYGLIVLVNIVVFLHVILRKEYQNGLYVFMIVVLLTRSYGQFLVSISKTLDMALIGNALMYFGAAFLPPFLFIIAMKSCKLNPPIPVTLTMLIYSLVIEMLATTAGKTTLYYDTVTLKTMGSSAVLEKTYGPLHALYVFMIIVYVAAFLILCAYAVSKKNQISVRVIGIMALFSILVGAGYWLDRHLNIEFDLNSVVYLLATAAFAWGMRDVDMHDLPSCIFDSSNNDLSEIVIVFDKKNRFINANKTARELFPEIADLSVGERPGASDSLFYNEIVKKVNEDTGENSFRENKGLIDIGDKKYELWMSNIVFSSRGKKEGTYVELNDVTVEEKLKAMDALYSRELEENVKKKEEEIEDTLNKLIVGLSELVSSRDPFSAGHVKRIAEGLKIFAERLTAEMPFEFTWEYLNRVMNAAPLHDIGKISIDDAVMSAGKNRTPEQAAKMKTHASEGARIVRRVLAKANDRKLVNIAVNIAAYHHENRDGTGYPAGLKGKEIPLEARIIAFVDRLDEKINETEVPFDAAFDDIMKDVGTKLDPVLGEKFAKCKEDLRKIYT